jgi:hypothetical protein
VLVAVDGRADPFSLGVAPGMPGALAHVIERAPRTRPAERFAMMRDLARELVPFASMIRPPSRSAAA